METKPRSVAIMFADVSGSVRLFDSLGDATAWELIKKCLAVMTEQVEGHNGRLVKTIGDEIMSTFPSADDAVGAAIAMQDRITQDIVGTDEASSSVTVRIGLHFGPVIPRDNDVFGDAVNLAARMAGAAKGGQIITTQETAELLSEKLRARSRHVDRMPIKGKTKPIDIYEVLWEEEGATRVSTDLLRDAVEEKEAHLTLRYHGQEMKLDHRSGGVVLGRGKEAGLRVNDPNASRLHVRIEFKRGKFVMTDESVNGTFVFSNGGEVTLRRKETHNLHGTGMIGLGREVAGNTEVVFFEAQDS